jgi:hypothetical protein
MPAIVVVATLQHVDEAFDVRINVGVRILQRIANAGLRGEMDDHAETVLSQEQLCGEALRAVGNGTAAPVREIHTRRGDPLRHLQARRSRMSDGRVEIDSNIVERAIRPQTITRKNALFAGSAGGGRTWATVATLLQTAKMNDVDPHAWLTQTLERIAQGWPISQIDQLMLWNFKA